jgi:HlyD family secretion protein
LKIHTRPGENIDSKGIIELGETAQMYAVAEVYESDIDRVKIGQRATMNLLNSAGTLSGRVEEIGLLVGKKDVLDTDPTADIDARVVEVRIRLDRASSQIAAPLSNASLKVKIPVEKP